LFDGPPGAPIALMVVAPDEKQTESWERKRLAAAEVLRGLARPPILGGSGPAHISRRRKHDAPCPRRRGELLPAERALRPLPSAPWGAPADDASMSPL
jgi:hypothetical protein